MRTHYAVVFAVVLGSHVAGAQSLVGTVRDSAGRPVSGAEVSIGALGRITHADDAGHYLLANVTPGMRLVRVRHVGYVAFSRMMQVLPGDSTVNNFVLARLAVTLDTVVTRDQKLFHEDPSLREFEENRKLGLGHFLTRADLEKLRGRPLSDGLQQMSGSQILSGGGTAYLTVRRGVHSMQNNTCDKFEERNGPPGYSCGIDCFPPVYLDGVPLSKWFVPNLNRFAPEQVESMEVYTSPAETPAKYAGLGSQCGVILIHTRRPP